MRVIRMLLYNVVTPAIWHVRSPADRLFIRHIAQASNEETLKLRITGLGNSPVTGEFTKTDRPVKILPMWLQGKFTHTTAVQRSWHVHNFVVIGPLYSGNNRYILRVSQIDTDVCRVGLYWSAGRSRRVNVCLCVCVFVHVGYIQLMIDQNSLCRNVL